MITYEQLKEHLDYDPGTGDFTWLKRKHNKQPGEKAGFICKGKGVYIWFDKKGYRAHRLAWLWMTGSWPKDQIDHIDRNQDNNSWANLREATPSQNSQNTRRKPPKESGVKGVRRWSANSWRAAITCKNKVHEIGTFPTLDAAADAVRKARNELHGEFACHD